MAGVKDTAVIDYISTDNDQLKLVMVEDREWDSLENMYIELQEKLTNYLTFIESGQLDEKYPELSNAKKVIRLDSVYPESEYARLVINKIRELLSSKGIGFEFGVLKEN